jgi:hypothetical protein
MRPNSIHCGLLLFALLGSPAVSGAAEAAADAPDAYPCGWWSGWPPKAVPIVVVPASVTGPSVVEAGEAAVPAPRGPDLPEGEFLVEAVLDPEGRTVAASVRRGKPVLEDSAAQHLLAPILRRRYERTVVFGAAAYVCLELSVGTSYE